MLLTLDGNVEALTSIKKALKDSGTIKAREVGAGKAVFHLRGMTEGTSKEDVTEAIATQGEIKRDLIETSDLRPNKGDTPAATVSVPIGLEGRLLECRKIRVGLAQCRVQKRLSIRK